MHPQGFISVPFKTESEHGLTSYNGVAKFSPAGIVLEFESKILGMIPGGVKEVRLPIAEILDIKFKKGFFRLGAKIIIRTRTFAVLAALPNSNGRVSLKLIREDFELGKNAVDQLNKEISGYIDELPPPRTPVGELFGDESEDETRQLGQEHEQ
jgi:hypothetical protein